MLRAVIIDDEQNGINTLKLLLEMFAKEIKVVAETTEAEKGIDLINDYRPEIVFLDVQMPFMNGFELLERISYKKFSLIFTTAYEEYALKAIKSNAVDYLLKPIVGDHLKAAIAKVKAGIAAKVEPDLKEVVAALGNTGQARLSISMKDSIEYILLDDIIRLESDSNYTRIHLVNGKTSLNSKTLKDYEATLCTPGKNFMRVNISNIVNLKHVTKYLKEEGGIIITKDNARLSLSKTKRDNFIKWLGI